MYLNKTKQNIVIQVMFSTFRSGNELYLCQERKNWKKGENLKQIDIVKT